LPSLADEDLVLWEEIQKGKIKRRIPNTDEYEKRIKEEYELIKEKGFSSYFLIQKMMIDEARNKSPEILGFGDGSEAVGPGRGSFCGE
jgi:DNA polymerase-3 subunit alpha